MITISLNKRSSLVIHNSQLKFVLLSTRFSANAVRSRLFFEICYLNENNDVLSTLTTVSCSNLQKVLGPFKSLI